MQFEPFNLIKNFNATLARFKLDTFRGYIDLQ